MHAFETVVAALTVIACAVLLVRLGVGARRRARFDAALRRLRLAAAASLRRPWGARARRRDAEREARALIERARRSGEREGNVIRPESFRRPNKPH